MELNQTPIRTSVNYGINSINIKNANLADFCNKNNQNNSNFKNFSINHSNGVVISYNKESKLNQLVSQELHEELENNSNLNLNLTFNKNSNQPTIIHFNFNKLSNVLIGTLNLNISEDVNSKIIIKFTNDNVDSYYNGIININLNDRSNADVIIYNNITSQSNTFLSLQSKLQKNAKLDINLVNFAEKNSIFNYNSKLLGENSTSNINSLYLGFNDSVIDINYFMEIFSPNCKVNMDVIGALKDNATKHFKGTIDFKKGCKKSVGNENEFCMLLSKNTKSKALPMLLCTEEDVDGKHSSSVGKVDEKELFYIMSRGLEYNEAVKLIVKAKFNNLINEIFDEELKNEILNIIDRKI